MASEATPSAFDAHRARLFGIAYRILGSRADAEDVVQDCWLKWQAAGAQVENPAAWLTTVATRRAVDVLRAAQRARVDYVGEWLPEPVLTDTAATPEEAVELSSSLSTAFLLLLERLSPKERAAFLLHEIFGSSYADVADTLGVAEPACRKLVSRAKAHVSAPVARYRPPAEQQAQMLAAFQAAVLSGEPRQLATLLAEDVALRADGGGKATAIPTALVGADVIGFATKGLSRWWAQQGWTMAELNGQLGWLLTEGATLVAAVTFGYGPDGRIAAIQVMRNPDKLDGLRAALRPKV